MITSARGYAGLGLPNRTLEARNSEKRMLLGMLSAGKHQGDHDWKRRETVQQGLVVT